jgi:hypothetical protein
MRSRPDAAALIVAAGRRRAGVIDSAQNQETDMTGMGWIALAVGALAVLVVAALALRDIGAARWADQVRTQTRLLESGRVGALGPRPPTARFAVQELEGLPAPVQRYFRAVLTNGQPLIAAASIEMAGTMNLSISAEQWKPFTSWQRVVTRPPGFLWNARIDMLPGVPAHVEDSYIAGQGRLMAKLMGWLTVADLQGDGEIARGEFMRYLAEAAWYPTALLPSQGVRWQAVDDGSASATLVDGPIAVTLLFRFNGAGLIDSVRAESRGAGLRKDGLLMMLPWDCSLSDYQLHEGMLIPRVGEAAWIRPAGRQAYFRGQVSSLRYAFLP